MHGLTPRARCRHAAQGKKYAAYETPKKSADRTFVLTHFAGEVVYTIEGWVDKNKDELSADVTALMEARRRRRRRRRRRPPPSTTPPTAPAHPAMPRRPPAAHPPPSRPTAVQPPSTRR